MLARLENQTFRTRCSDMATEDGRVDGRRPASRGVRRLTLVSSRPHRTVHAVLPHTAHRRSHRRLGQ